MHTITQSHQVQRDSYGALFGPRGADSPLTAADTLIAAAVKARKLPPAFDSLSWDRKGRADGEALHHEVYDVNPAGTRALVCLRTAEGSKYGVRTTDKRYVVVARHGAGVRVLDANKAVAAKAAKAAGTLLGIAIDTALGKCKLTIKSTAPRTGYKLLRRTATGFASVFDGSAWEIGKARVEAATDDHTGGYYYYATLDECLAAAAAAEAFAPDLHAEHPRLAVVEVQASGRHYAHRGVHGTKLCATRVTPVREIASTLQGRA
jgi:hypothetical protein